MERPRKLIARNLAGGVAIAILLVLFAVQTFAASDYEKHMFSSYDEANPLHQIFEVHETETTNETSFAPPVYTVQVGSVSSMYWSFSGGWPNLSQNCIVAAIPGPAVFSLNPTGPYSGSIWVPNTLNSAGNGGTPLVYIKGMSPYNNLNVQMTCPVGSIAPIVWNVVAPPPPSPAPTPTPTPTPVTRVVADWNTIAVQQLRNFVIEVSNATPNSTKTLFVGERISYLSNNGNYVLGFSMTQGDSFSPSLSVALQTDANGYGRTQPIFVRGINESSAYTNPPPAIMAWSISGGAIPAMTPHAISVTPPPPPAVRFRTSSSRNVGVGTIDQNYVVIYYGQPNTSTSVLVTVNENGDVSIASSPEGPFTDSLQLPIQLDGNGYGRTGDLWVKGLAANVAAWNGISARYIHPITIQEATMSSHYQVTNVVSVTLERLPGTSPLSSNTNPGGGLRIFPEKMNAHDVSLSYDLIKIKAKLSAPIIGVHVDFFSRDVDDPWSDDPLVDANGREGRDNRGMYEANFVAGQSDLTTNSLGEAYAVFKVSKQPGDNWLFGATSRGSYSSTWSDIYETSTITVDGTTLRERDGDVIPIDTAPSPSTRFVASQMVTVWRRLHIERDSMGPVIGNYITGDVNASFTGSTFTKIEVTIPAAQQPSFESMRFENGRIVLFREDVVNSTLSFNVLGNGGTASTYSLKFQGTTTQNLSGWKFKLFDDDDMNAEDGATKGGDEGEDVPSPKTGWMQDSPSRVRNRFADAYIQPTYDLTGNDENLPFYLNLPQADTTQELPTSAEVVALQKFDNVGSRRDPDFWVTYLMNAYQCTKHLDGDGSDSELLLGMSNSRIGAMTFMEGMSESDDHLFREESDDSYHYYHDFRYAAVHEVGHLFFLVHEVHLDGFIANLSPYFSNKELGRIRTMPHPMTAF